MRRIFILPVLFTFLVMPFFVRNYPSSNKDKGKKYPSVYRTHITIDGKANEWPDSLFLLNPDAKIRYAVVNDSNNLYFCLKVFDDNQQMKMLRGGMEVWIDPAGKKGKSCGILFPLSTTLNPGNRSGMRQGDPSAMKQMKLLFILQAKDMELTGFKDGVNGILSNTSGKTGVMTIIRLDSTDILTCEAKIPLNVFKTDLARSIPLSVGFIIKGLERPKMQEGEDAHGMGMENREGGGGRGGEYGGGGMGGHGGGGHNHHEGTHEGGGGEPHQMMFEDTPMWIKIILAH